MKSIATVCVRGGGGGGGGSTNTGNRKRAFLCIYTVICFKEEVNENNKQKVLLYDS